MHIALFQYRAARLRMQPPTAHLTDEGSGIIFLYKEHKYPVPV